MRVGKPVNLARLNKSRVLSARKAFFEDLAATVMFCILVTQLWFIMVAFSP